MAVVTLSYDAKNGGWVSRYSFEPDMMINLNSSMYSFKDGNLYKHDDASTYNTFYEDGNGDPIEYDSKITTIFNQDPLIKKIYKTLHIDGTEAWDVVTTTDLNDGQILKEYFQEKEGEWFSYIRRPAGETDPESLNTQGIGSIVSYAAGVITFGFNYTTSVNIGDKIYIIDGSGLQESGTVESVTSTTITLNPVANAPSPNDFALVVKDSEMESLAQRGNYMIVELTNDNNDSEVELFAISSEAIKSSP
jgi:hypothetical protein